MQRPRATAVWRPRRYAPLPRIGCGGTRSARMKAASGSDGAASARHGTVRGRRDPRHRPGSARAARSGSTSCSRRSGETTAGETTSRGIRILTRRTRTGRRYKESVSRRAFARPSTACSSLRVTGASSCTAAPPDSCCSRWARTETTRGAAVKHRVVGDETPKPPQDVGLPADRNWSKTSPRGCAVRR